MIALFAAACLLGLGDLAGGAPPEPVPGDATALATAWGEITSDAQPLVPVTAVAAPDEQVADVAPPPTTSVPTPFAFPTRPEQWFAPSGRNQGTEGLARFLAAVALADNKPLYLSDTWGRTTGPDSSDHSAARTDSWACDVAVLGIQVPTPQTELAARRVAAALGEANWAGGDLTKTVDGYRFQILWKVADHFNHVHIGVRKVA